MIKKILAVFGDESFPRLGAGHLPTRRQTAADNIISFFKTVQPELVYLVPTPGTCCYVAVVCNLLEIPYILVSPYPGFFDTVNSKDRALIAQAVEGAKSVIIINNKRISKKKAWTEAVQFLTSVTEVVAFMYNSKGSKKYQKFMDDYSDKYFEKKLLLELPYNDGKILLE